jgi:hypothetical protein
MLLRLWLLLLLLLPRQRTELVVSYTIVEEHPETIVADVDRCIALFLLLSHTILSMNVTIITIYNYNYYNYNYYLLAHSCKIQHNKIYYYIIFYINHLCFIAATGT